MWVPRGTTDSKTPSLKLRQGSDDISCEITELNVRVSYDIAITILIEKHYWNLVEVYSAVL